MGAKPLTKVGGTFMSETNALEAMGCIRPRRKSPCIDPNNVRH